MLEIIQSNSFNADRWNNSLAFAYQVAHSDLSTHYSFHHAMSALVPRIIQVHSLLGLLGWLFFLQDDYYLI